ncbi:hypothetical protein OH809_44790 (plasmid) [Streptomyces sp. NBC_00873]|uniref:DUF6895 family protein n=1 Tax=unclassified Streptomyces TaxID=2593676 RepID=UPI002F90AAA6|nr:hypothetical protein OH809_44790 [Streptomyces sp. NBC_00873]WTA49225.1 hypothetical protein OH821_43830 [Streptomyces sp. NBC_00842]
MAAMDGSMRAARRLCQWLEQHVPDFCTDTHRLDGLIRVAEFTIVLLGLTRPLSSGASGDVYARWAHGVADVLWADLHRKEKYVLRSLAATRSAHARALLLPFPALETITRRRFDNHAMVRALLSEGAGRTGHLEVDVAFTCDVAGLGDCREATCTRLAELSGAAGPPGESVQGMYDLTHLAFYATILGRRAAHWSPGMAGWARAFLEEGGAVFLRRHDLDLVAECVMSLLITGSPISRYVHDAAEALAAVAEDGSGMPPHPRHADDASSAFANRYHPTLVGLAALAEYDRRMPRSR